MIYYNQNNIVVRNSMPEDALMKLRPSDIREIWASDHLTPFEALSLSVQGSEMCFTVEMNDEPIALFGAMKYNDDRVGEDVGTIWLLASEKLNQIGRRFVRHSKKFINMMLDRYGFLFNFVDNRNEESIEWLKYCGATIDEPRPYGCEGLPFRYFYFQRG